MALLTSSLASSWVCLQNLISTRNTNMNLSSVPNPSRAEESPHHDADVTVNVLLSTRLLLTSQLKQSPVLQVIELNLNQLQ